MSNKLKAWNVVNLVLGAIVFLIGLLNLFLVHAVPGIVFLLLSFIYFPPTDTLLKECFGFTTPPLVKTILGVLAIWFTLGVSDLGDMIDDSLARTTVIVKSNDLS